MPPDHAPDDRRIPVTLLTGFLGAGKTTLLNHLLKLPEMARAAVLINEFGEVGVDHHLVERVDHHLVERVDDSVVVLDSGCLCCAVRGDLARALRKLFMGGLSGEVAPVSRVLVETTGLADPAPVIHTLMEDLFIADRYRCDGVVTAVDATHAPGQLARHPEAVRQAVMADRLLLTKCDLASQAELAALAETLAQLNPGAPQLRVSHGQVSPEAVFNAGLFDPGSKAPDVVAWLAEEAVRAQARRAAASRYRYAPGDAPASPAETPRHDASVHSFVLTFEGPLDWFDFGEALRTLQATCGERLLRIKGLVNVAGDPLPRVIQAVQHVIYPPASLPAWPATGPYADHRSRLVFIVRDLDRALVEQAFALFCGVRDVG
ncbi:MAG: GTP-binding protein [Rhodocyclaceae bacterium]|jgi:G3E family GTPase|nr:GTP-binding protein [Rhodocyclaceae bacterium]